jgi:hypothetical protein
MSFQPIQDVKLSRKVIDKIKRKYKWAIFTIGSAKMSVTRSGGIHSSGRETEQKSIFFELKRGGGYIGISLLEYPKGVVFHSYVSINDMDKKNKISWEGDIIKPLYEDIKNILQESI